jgi:hypothetical protein
MAPPNDAVSATDVLRPGAAGPSFTLTGSAAGANTQTSGSGISTEVVTPEDATTVPAGSDAAQAGVGAEILTPLDDKGQPTSEQPAATTPAANAPAPAVAPSPATNGTVDAGLNGSGTANPPADNATPTAAVSNSTNSSSSSSSASGTTGATAATGDGAAPAAATAQSGAQPAAQASTPAKPTPVDTSSESTSKKKKGIKKLIPW